MRRTVRCDHGFMKGLCCEIGCPHRERRRGRRASNNVKPKVCNRCGGPGTVRAWGDKHLCEGCASIVRERGPRGPLWLLAALALGCGGVDVPRIPTPGTCGLWQELTIIWPGERDEPDTCVWVCSDSRDVVFVPPGDCPSDSDQSCAIVLPGDGLEAWGELVRPESAALAVAFPLLEDGTCAATCGPPEYGCEPSEDAPSICVPCTAAEPCL